MLRPVECPDRTSNCRCGRAIEHIDLLDGDPELEEHNEDFRGEEAVEPQSGIVHRALRDRSVRQTVATLRQLSLSSSVEN